MFVDPAPDAEGKELIQAYAANDGAQGLHTNLIHYGFALFVPVAYAMVGLVRGRGAWIANIAGILAVIGLSTLPGLVLLDYFSVGVEHVAGLETAFASQNEVEKLPGFTALLVPAFLSSMLAVPLAAVAMWHAGLMAWWLPLVVAVAFLGPNVIAGCMGGFTVMAVGMLVLGWALWRMPVAVWYGATSSDAADPVRNDGSPATA